MIGSMCFIYVRGAGRSKGAGPPLMAVLRVFDAASRALLRERYLLRGFAGGIAGFLSRARS